MEKAHGRVAELVLPQCENRLMHKKLPILIDLPDGFLDPEVKCGYEISSRQKRILAVELDLLKTFLDACRKYNIRVQAFAGTLLGAVRHKGFIPWDDDIDVCMDRANFDKLLALPADAFQAPYFLQTSYSEPKCFFSYARLRNSSTTAIIAGQDAAGCNNGIYIDIFVLDGLSANRAFRKIQFTVKYVLERLLEDFWVDEIREKRFATVVSFLLKPFSRIVGYDTLRRLHKLVITWFDDKSERLAMISHIESFAEKYQIPRAALDDVIELPFENITVPAPRNYHEVLTRIYGNYMEYPPLSERGKWHEGVVTFDPDMAYDEFISTHRRK